MRIGNTPLVRINSLSDLTGVEILVSALLLRGSRKNDIR